MKIRAFAVMLAIFAPAALASAATFDCKRAKANSIDSVVCQSPLLSALDLEMDRVYRIAIGPEAGPEAGAVRKAQRAWSKRRNACAQSSVPQACARDLYLERIAAVRSGSKAAREADEKGISFGPVAFHCGTANDVLMTTFVNAGGGLLWITRRNQSYLLEQTRSGSGARYESAGRVFWEHQGQASWRDGATAPNVDCKQAEAR